MSNEHRTLDLLDPRLMMKVVKVQGFVWISLSFIALVFGITAGLSAFMGGACITVPSGYMAWRLNRPVADAGKAFAHMLNAELGKLALTGVLVYLSFSLMPDIEAVTFFLVLVVGLLCNALVPLFTVVKSAKDTQQNVKI